MPANPWELRADVRPLEVAAERWAEVAAVMARRGDELVEAARRATEGWDAAAAESYEQHRRQVLANLDRFTALALQVSSSLQAIGSILTASQKELDQAWTTVALVPHEVVGEQRYLVFKPDDDDGRGKVDHGKVETDEIRARLADSLEQESARLRASRAELVSVRTELTTLAGGTFARGSGVGTLPGFGPGGEESGVGTFAGPPSTSVLGSAQSGVTAAALPPVAPISVDMPHLTGLSAAALGPLAAGAVSGLARRGGERRTTTGTPPPVGGMGMGAAGARGGSMSSGMAGGRAGARRFATPRLEGEDDESAARARQAEKEAEKEAQKEAKRAALEEKRAERAARKAQREAARTGRSDPSAAALRKDARGKADDEDDTDEQDRDDLSIEVDDEPTDRPAAITVVHYETGEEPPSDVAPDAGPATGADAGGAEDVRRS